MHPSTSTRHADTAALPCVPDDDTSLVRRAANGDEAAFELLFQRHRDGLQGFLFRRLRSHEEAEDAMLTTFYKAWRARTGFRGECSGKGWLYQIAGRVALDTLRRRRTPAIELDAPDTEFEVEADGAQVDPEHLLLDGERIRLTRTAVDAALDRLPIEERRLLRMFYFEDRDYDQISHLLGVTRSQVRGRLFRIRGRLRRELAGNSTWQTA